MSILPIDVTVQSSSSSSQASSPNPSSDHGFLLSSDTVSAPLHTFASLQISPDSPFSATSSSGAVSAGLLAPAAEDSSGSSEKVIDLGALNDEETVAQLNTSTHSPCCPVDDGGAGSSRSRGKQSKKVDSPNGQRTTATTNFRGITTHSAGRKPQTMNGNHLLNFHYDPISRPRPQLRAPPPRRQQKIKPYNKDLFLQANYKFVVLDTGNYASESMDPDKMLQWEDIICVKYSTPSPVQCPICLEFPLCPQITSCGHIFCFSCILRYLLMGTEDNKGDCWKRCPLCFMMVSSKELYTLYIETVKQYSVGDTAQFVLLTRQKDSFTPSQAGATSSSCNDDGDSFSKFTFTSDVDLSVRQAISDLDTWLVRAESGLIDDLEKLPYVCAAMEQLEQRKKYWYEHQSCNGNNSKACKYPDLLISTNPETETVANADDLVHGFASVTLSKCLGNSVADESDKGASLTPNADEGRLLEGDDAVLSSSYEEIKSFQRHPSGFRATKEKDSYNFYQAVDGQHLILHPINMKCLLHHYGSYDMLPRRIDGRILQLETVTQSEEIRRRYRYLSHFSLTTTFQLCEIDLSELLPLEALSPFMDEIKKREKQRKKVAQKNLADKMKAEAASARSITIPLSSGHSFHDEFTFSMDDFKALGNSPATSSSPPIVGERKLFSNVTRLGFAAGHDSPALKAEGSQNPQVTHGSSGVAGLSKSRGSPSFANVISRAESVETVDVPTIGKKGKKPNRVLLSTTGGRRY